jgi:hypothetical protein
VQLAHAGDDGLARFFVGTHAERRIFLSQTVQGEPIFSWSALVFGSTACESPAREDHFPVMIELDRTGFHRWSRPSGPRSGDVAGAHFFDFFALVGVHLQNTADTLLLPLTELYTVSPELITPEYTRKKVSWPTNGSVMILKASAENFSSSSALRLAGSSSSSVPGPADVHRRRQVVDHGVQHGLHALVLEGGTAQHRHDFGSDGTLRSAS